jgi:hypothetical protein
MLREYHLREREHPTPRPAATDPELGHAKATWSGSGVVPSQVIRDGHATYRAWNAAIICDNWKYLRVVRS